MSLFAIADTHLSFGTDKPMDMFTGWNDYVSRLEENWNKVVNEDDYVVIAGDISWAMNFNELAPDFDFINKLNGKKIIFKGNHDYWWNTKSKIEKFINENSFDTIKVIQNAAFPVGKFTVCGSRGWMFDGEEENDKKILNREVLRLKMSIDDARQYDGKPILFLHYPPLTLNSKCDEIFQLLKDEQIERCYYGHLHGHATRTAVNQTVDGIKFSLISADYLHFCPILIEKF